MLRVHNLPVEGVELELTEMDPDIARAKVTEMCEKLLANTVIENYAIEITGT